MGGVHDSCAARARIGLNTVGDEWSHLQDGHEEGGWAARLRKLPGFRDVFEAMVYTREYTHRGLLTLYRQEFGRLCANVVRFNRMDAWDQLLEYGGETDTVEMKRCRVAWTEWAMFAKCVLRAEPRGVRPAQAYGRAKCRLEQWIGGERESLWNEVALGDARVRKKSRAKGGISKEAREQRVNKLTGKGKSGKAMQALITPGVAADNATVRGKLGGKFLNRALRVVLGYLPNAAGAEVEDFIKEVRSFDADAGAGPSGLRPRFMKELVGEKGEDPCVQAMFEVTMLFVEGRVPRFLRQWYAGGTLVGIGKDDKPLDEDARPIVVGEVWRRVAGKVALLADKSALSGWLKPSQVAVGVKAGSEVIVHSLRQWWERNRDNTRVVLLKKDYSNAFNEAEPNAFLNTACRQMPGSARLAEWCYGEGSNLIYNGRVFKVSERGQQGCPLMMPMFCAMKREMRDRIPEVSGLGFAADFADDGVDGGDCDTVLKVLEKEIELGPEYGLRNNYSKMVVYPLAGDQFRGDLSKFVALGIPVDYSGNVKFMQVPIVGSAAFFREWATYKLGIIKGILEGISGLSQRQVALYLLRKTGHGCRVLYYLRSTPRDLIEEFVKDFDASLRSTFENVVGLATSDAQWEQAGLRVKESGLGLSRAGDLADVAYLCSRDVTFEDCQALDCNHVWDDGVDRTDREIEFLGEWLSGCVTRVNACLPEVARFRMGRRPGTAMQGLLMDGIHKRRREEMVGLAGVWDKARLQAMSASKAGSWLDALPNRALDTHLSNAEVQYGVGRRLGIELCAEHPCPFCMGTVDKFGGHCESCTAGGDKTVNHNVVRDDIYQHARRAHTAPRLEACGVSRLLGLQDDADGRVRPADVLLCRAQDIQTGVGPEGAGKVALDVGIICPQAIGHLDNTAGEPLGAAEEYVKTKCARGETERKCREAGVVFQPMIFESTGGVSAEAERVVKCLNKAVAGNSDSSEVVVATQFWHRIGVDLLRGSCRSFGRRLGDECGGGLLGNFYGVGGLAIAGEV